MLSVTEGDVIPIPDLDGNAIRSRCLQKDFVVDLPKKEQRNV